MPETLSSVFKDGNIRIQEEMRPYDMVALINYILKSKTPCKSLTLSDCKITNEGLSILQGFFYDYKEIISSIEYVCLSKNYITSLWGTQSDQSMSSDNGLLLVPHLNLSETLSNDNGMMELFINLQYNKTLLQLDVSQNDISFIGAMAISKCLKNNETLQKLDISHNKLFDDGIKTISNSLRTNGALKMLNISDNNITNTGATQIAEAIKVNTTLSHINISRNLIGKEGITNILVASTETKTLHTLDCIHNILSRSDYLDITDYVRKETTIKKINISWYWITCDEVFHELINTVICYEDGHDKESCIRDRHCIKSNDPELVHKIIYCCVRDPSLEQLHLIMRKQFKDIKLLDITAEAIRLNKTLTKLHINKYDIDSDEALTIGKCIELNILKELNISNNNITNKAMRKIVQDIAHYSTSLQILNISSNNKVHPLSVSVIKFIGVFLKNTKALQELIMACTGMSDEGARIIAKEFKVTHHYLC
ncbi:NLR family CARD domain-containing protein 3-like [Dysidea avara]|uniref:NLR family CARD domain-containing protein 3-like n=1 Tax=Dysidea avara TaxID=196820 RepID=UPI0033179D55